MADYIDGQSCSGRYLTLDTLLKCLVCCPSSQIAARCDILSIPTSVRTPFPSSGYRLRCCSRSDDGYGPALTSYIS